MRTQPAITVYFAQSKAGIVAKICLEKFICLKLFMMFRGKSTKATSTEDFFSDVPLIA